MKTIISFLIQKSKVLKSLKFRIFTLVVLVGIFSISIVSESIFSNYHSRALSTQTTNALNQSRVLANHLVKTGFLEKHDEQTIDITEELNVFSSFFNGRIMIIDSNYVVVADSYNMSVGKYMVSKEIIGCAKYNSTVQQYDEKNHYIETAVPITDDEKTSVMGVVFLSTSTDNIIDNVDVLRRKAGILRVALVTFIILLAAFVSSLLVKPFVKITNAINSVDNGFGIPEEKIPDYIETVDIMDAFSKLLTRMKTLDDSREEFVSNVSHELKTPLASMKVLSDSIRGSDDVPIETYREFMDDIAEEVDRENTIINDLLSLVKMDKTAGKPNISEVDVNLMSEQIIKRLRPIADKNNVELMFESEKQINAEIDETKLTLAISNLVENAIKYNKPGGWVKLELDADHQFFSVKVSDSGIGIPKDSLDHIYERFYRVDKSHSREIGGTGLGLAITRNAILMHRGAIKATSIEGEGTTFVVRIPIKYV